MGYDFHAAKTLREQGKSLTEVSVATGIPIGQLREYYTEHNITKPSRDAIFSKAVGLRRDGMTIKDISKITSINYDVLYRYLSTRNIQPSSVETRDQKLKEAVHLRVNEKKTVREISEILSLTESVIENYFHKHNIKKASFDHDLAANLRARSWSISAIAKHMGMSRSAVAAYFHKYAIETPRPIGIVKKQTKPVATRNGTTIRYFTPDEDRILHDMERDGYTDTEIARVLNRKPHTIAARRIRNARFGEENVFD